MIQLRNHTFYYRQIIPKRLQSLTTKSEVYFSLRTRNRDTAELRAALLLPLTLRLKHMANSEKLDTLALQQLIALFHRSFKPQNELSIESLNGELAYLDDTIGDISRCLSEPELKRTAPENYTKLNHGSVLGTELLTQVGCKEPNSRTRFETDKSLHQLCAQRIQQTTAAIYSPSDIEQESQSDITPTKLAHTTPPISELVCSFIEQQEGRGLSAGTIIEYEAKLRDLIEITSDVAVGDLDANVADFVRETLMKLPANRKKVRAYRNKSLRELAALDCKPMAKATVDSHISCYRAFYTWAVRYYTDVTLNPFKDMPTLKPERKIKASEERENWTKAELKILFASEVFASGKKPRINYYFWLPLLGIFTGARLNELCQLTRHDIKRIDGVPCIYVDDSLEYSKIKHANSRRYIPIHSKLIELGFLKFVETRKTGRLFSNLSFTEKAGYGANASKWFARYRRKLGLTKTFHSLRGTFTNEFKQSDVIEAKSAELLGHKDSVQGISYGRYAGDYSVKALQQTIELLDFSDELTNVKSPS